MSSLWSNFGFSDNPYNKEPLEATDGDFRLFASRDVESAKFMAQMACEDGCIVVVSGDNGIGKTSFVNIQQHIMATGQALIGPKLLPCLKLTPLIATDSPTDLARRVVHATVTNIEDACKKAKVKLPSQAEKVRRWMSHESSDAGYQIGIAGFEFGRTFSLPPVSDTTVETWCAILGLITVEAMKHLEVDGIVVCLDNAETLGENELLRLMMTFRDTLLVTKGVWWIVIGQSELYNIMDTIDPRVSQRISGKGIELSPFGSSEFHELISKRIQEYRRMDDAVSPLSEAIHEQLFEASRGEVRFVLDTADTLVREIITEVLTTISKDLVKRAAPSVIQKAVHDAVRHKLIDNRIPDAYARGVLRTMSLDQGKARKFSASQIEQLKLIGDAAITEADYARFGFSSRLDFVEKCLDPLRGQRALARQEIAGQWVYHLKGVVKLCHDFKIMPQLLVS